MNLIPIVLLVGLAALALLWLKKPNLARIAVPHLASLSKQDRPKPKLTKTF